MADVPEFVNGTADLSVAGYQLRIEMEVPTGRKRPIHLLPLFHSVANALVEVAETMVAEQGRTISCKKGCGACCRQLVPVSPSEARRLRELVDALPEPRRSEIRSRFADARARLEQAGMLERLADPRRFADTSSTLAIEYFRHGIACPFLEQESCSIHEDRPLACREYLVTSAAEHCSQPTAETVRCVKMPAEASSALLQLEPASADYAARWVTLALALDWANEHPDLVPERPGPELVRDFFDKLSGQKLASS
ncbi:MAG TPA: YkgJ family cysteine cluster protein [Polyangiales bacterium]|nr:YkgJ family cysteine cluster protein [Polyangiales bacterium]